MNSVSSIQSLTKTLSSLDLSEANSQSEPIASLSPLVQKLKTTFVKLVEKDQAMALSVEEILDFQDELNTVLSECYDDPLYFEIIIGTEILVTSVLSSGKYSRTIGTASNVLFHPHTLFIYEGCKYVLKATRGQGACALHALLGEEINGIYRFPGADQNSSENAKKHFTQTLDATFETNENVQTLFYEVISGYLGLSLNDSSAKILFAQSQEGREIKQKWLDMQNRHTKELQEKDLEEARFWFDSVAVKDSPIFKRLVQNSKALSTIKEQQTGEILKRFQEDVQFFANKIHEDRATLEKLLQEHNKRAYEQVTDLKEKREQLKAIHVAQKREFIFSDQVKKHYFLTVGIPQFYLDTTEIKLAAELFGLDVVLVSSTRTGVEFVEAISPHVEIHKEPIIIHHHGLHFSRCVRVEGQGELKNIREKQEPAQSATTDLFDEDAHPFGCFVPRSVLTVQNFDQKTGELECTITPEDHQRLGLMLCEYTAENPVQLLGITTTYSIPEAHAARFGIRALEQLIESADEEVSKAYEKLSEASISGQTELDSEKITSLLHEKENLKERAKQLKVQEQGLIKVWRQTVNDFYKIGFELFLHAVDQKSIDTFFDLFCKLKTLNPLSPVRFFPILTIMAKDIEKSALYDFFEESKRCDPYITYALTLFFIRQTITFKDIFIFKYYPVKEVLSILRKIYPRDLFLPIFEQAIHSESQSTLLSLPTIAQTIEDALTDLATNNSQSSTEKLVRATPELIGYSFLHRYLALTWVFRGCLHQARKILKRSSQLPDIHANTICKELSQKIIEMLSLMMPKSPSVSKEQGSSIPGSYPDPLEKFIELAEEQPLNMTLAKSFIDASIEALQDDNNFLPIVYFGLQYLTSRLSIKPHCFDTVYRDLFESLGKLITVTAEISYKAHTVDPWIMENFIRKEDQGKVSFVVRISSITWGLTSSKRENLPLFRFFNNLRLTPESKYSLATSITKKAYSLILGLITSHILPQYLVDNPIKELPDDAVLFIETLQSGLSISKETKYKRRELFPTAVGYLRAYLTIALENRPYLISSEILDWAKFCVFSIEPPFFLSPSTMESEMFDSFYPKNFIVQEISNSVLKVNSCFPRFISRAVPTPLVSVAFRDVLLVDYYLREAASLNSTLYVQESMTMYSLFRLSQHLFGWRYSESFDDWGKRLKSAEEYSLAVSDFTLFLQSDTTDRTSSTQGTTIEGNINKPFREALRLLLRFWIEFHKKTSQKNIFIQKGGDEEDPENKRKEKDWHRDIENKKWLTIIRTNGSGDYPNFKRLDKDDKAALEQIVKNKYVHYKQIEELKNFCKPPGYLKEDESIIILSAALIANAECDRAEAYHSVHVENEEQARRIYQIILHVSAERLFRGTLQELGFEGWLLRDNDRLQETIIPMLSELTGAFHGPESHISGNGPAHLHYNAGVITSSLNSINTHIYYGN